jgi:hypothetical protein
VKAVQVAKFRTRELLGSLAVATIFGMPSSAWACRTLVPNNDRIAEHNGVVVVAIKTGARLNGPGWNTWRLRARRLAVVAGSGGRKEYSFITAQSSDGCGRTPLPPEGEKWVIYFDSFAPEEVVEAFPLSLVREHDPRLANVR